MADSNDDLEPLFDYHRVQPSINFVHIDDDGCDASPVVPKNRIKTSKHGAVQNVDEEVEVLEIVNPEVNEDEDWLPPPPKISLDEKQLGENSTLKQLRIKKQELEALAKAKDFFLSVEKSLKVDQNASLSGSLETGTTNPSQSQRERAKIVISIQDKEEVKQFRVYKDEKFERLFKVYAEKAKLEIESLVFSFDGDKISLTATPEGLGMEDDDIIEVHTKKH